CSAAWHRNSSCTGCRKPKPENKSELRKMRGSIARCSPGCKPSWQRFLSDPALRIESLRDTSSAFADASVSKSHDVVPAIYVDHFASDPGTGIGSQEYASGTDFVYIHIPLQRRALGVRFLHIAESCNAACSQRFDRSAGANATLCTRTCSLSYRSLSLPNRASISLSLETSHMKASAPGSDRIRSLASSSSRSF